MFHERSGDHVRLSEGNRTACRTASEFNHGLVFSSKPLTDDELFEVSIDKKIESWIGSMEIGVTALDPDLLAGPPASAGDLRSGTWILSGKSVFLDGRSLFVENYPLNLDKVQEGERIGVRRSAAGELEFSVNGISHGVAATGLPPRVFAVIDIYGKISQISVSSPLPSKNGQGDADEVRVESMELSCEPERLRFHERTGTLIKLSCSGRAAERMRPLDEFNNAVVMSQNPLQPDELFEIRIDRLVEKWSGSIEVGVTTHDPSLIDFPATMTNMRSGTIMMSGCGILTNGKGTKREYGEFNLDELRVGDRIGMMRKSSGDLHYFINGLDQGVAATRVPPKVWGVVDLYGMTAKVTIVNRDEREEQNLITRRNTVLRENALQTINDSEDAVDDTLCFHTNCGSHAAVINNGRTAHRPNALDDFNNAVVLTNRPLRPNEVFEVRLDKMVPKWAGSIEIGVTTHAPTELEYPLTMTNVRSGTWIMTGNGVMHNGTSVIEDYGQNLDRLQTGDRVGLVLHEEESSTSLSLHFLVNGEDQGVAGTGLPPGLYGVADLYGQATQVTIVSRCSTCSPSSSLNDEIHFHSVHGRNARVINGGRTALRPRAVVEFDDALVVSNRPLKPNETFSVVIDRLLDRWSGSVRAGVTGIKPEDLELPGSMTDLDRETWMLSGGDVLRDGVVQCPYSLDLDKVGAGSILGMKRVVTDEGHLLHFYLDGEDMGPASGPLPDIVYPVIDLYGQCTQVSIVPSSDSTADPDDSLSLQQIEESRVFSEPTVQHPAQPQPQFHKWCEMTPKGLRVSDNGTLVSRTIESGPTPGGLVFSSAPLIDSELFEIVIDSYKAHWAGSLRIGVSCKFIPNATSISTMNCSCWYLQDSRIFKNDKPLKIYSNSLDWLREGSKIGMKLCPGPSLHFFINGVDQGPAAYNLSKKSYAFVDLSGPVSALKIVSKALSSTQGDAPLAVLDIESPCENKTSTEDDSGAQQDADQGPLMFHDCHGRNVQISESRLTAKRVSSYNQGLVVLNRPLTKGSSFKVKIESLNSRWTGSLSIGLASSTALNSLPLTSLALRSDALVLSGDTLYRNGRPYLKKAISPSLDALPAGSTVGLKLTLAGGLAVVLNDKDIELGPVPGMDDEENEVMEAVIPGPNVNLPVIDLYGMCDEVSIVNNSMDVPPVDLTREKGNCETGEKSSSVHSLNHVIRTKTDKMNENIQCYASAPVAAAVSPVTPPTHLDTEEKRIMNEALKSPSSSSASLRSLCSPMTPSSSPCVGMNILDHRPPCDYLSACFRLRSSLGLPNGYFRKEAICYCSNCLNVSNSKETAIGWTLFPLKRKKETSGGGEPSWDRAYLHSEPGQVRKVLDAGKPLTPGEMSFGGETRPEDRKLEESENTSRLVVTPVLNNEGKTVKEHRFTDPKTGHTYSSRSAFLLSVRPSSYKIASPSEWVTKERNSTTLLALLLRLDPFTP